MANFPGGSAYAMTMQIAAGHLLVTDRTFVRLQHNELDTLSLEMERRLRELRSVQVGLDDTMAIQNKNRSINRVTSALGMLRSHRQRRRR